MKISSLKIKSEEEIQFIDITKKVNELIEDKKGGVLTVFSKHTTTGLTINENEKRLINDIKALLNDVVKNKEWEHDKIDNNAKSHLKSILLDSSISIPFKGGNLSLGTWQSLFLVEFDGPRTREILISKNS